MKLTDGQRLKLAGVLWLALEQSGDDDAVSEAIMWGLECLLLHDECERAHTAIQEAYLIAVLRTVDGGQAALN